MAAAPEPMTDRFFEEIAKRFRLLSDPVRLKILSRLNQEPTSVGELATLTGTSQPNVSKHLAVLREGGVVARRREGSVVHYEVVDGSVFDLCRLVCGGIETQLETQQALLDRTREFASRASWVTEDDD